jgi:hypothetical protein
MKTSLGPNPPPSAHLTAKITPRASPTSRLAARAPQLSLTPGPTCGGRVPVTPPYPLLAHTVSCGAHSPASSPPLQQKSPSFPGRITGGRCDLVEIPERLRALGGIKLLPPTLPCLHHSKPRAPI